LTSVQIGIISIIVAILLAAIPVIYKKFRAPIIISPKQVGLSSQMWSIKTTFHVQNRTNKVLFDVWIKLTVENSGMRSNDIKISSGSGTAFLEARISNISINYDFVRMDGIDNNGNGCIFFILYSLDPQIPQPFTIGAKAVAEKEKDRNPQIALRVIRHSKTPVKLLQRKNEIVYPFTPPEKFRIKSLLLLMKRK
jgi:hypothetical protein